jgi:HPt (histidine-containing phosphotransfer) domain-containing protein
MADDRQRCLDAGMDDYVTKPLRLESLTAVLERWELGGSQQFAADDSAEAISPLVDDPEELREMPRPVLDAHVLGNLDRLGKKAGVDLVAQLAALFLVDADNQVAAMHQALVAGDPMGVARSAHALRGASANLGATDLAWVCETLELHGGAKPENVGNLWAEVRSVETELELVRSVFAAQVAMI